jgi:hypothetical protein
MVSSGQTLQLQGLGSVPAPSPGLVYAFHDSIPCNNRRSLQQPPIPTPADDPTPAEAALFEWVYKVFPCTLGMLSLEIENKRPTNYTIRCFCRMHMQCHRAAETRTGTRSCTRTEFGSELISNFLDKLHDHCMFCLPTSTR